MKCKLLLSMKSWLLMALVTGALTAYAQPPANDNCSGAFDVPISTIDNPTWVDGDSRNSVDAATSGIPVCSGNFYRDDIWFKFTTPSTPNEAGYIIKFNYNIPNGMNGVGIATYTSCDANAGNLPIICTNGPANDQIISCTGPDQTIYIRVWSNDGPAANWQAGWGTVQIAIYPAEPASGSPANVLWGDQPGQGDFDGGLSGWTTEGYVCANDASGNPVDGSNALWTWTQAGRGYYTFGGATVSSIDSRTYCNGAMIFDSGFLHFGTAGTPASGTCPWADHEGALISPVIDISSFNVQGVSVLFNQNMQRWREGRHYIDYSLDGGANWTAIEINNDYTYLSTDPSTGDGYYNEEKRVALPNEVIGAAQLRIRFRFQGMAYWWVIDDVKIIERECDNMRANPFFAIAPNAMWHFDQLEPFVAMIDIQNLGSCPQTNVNVSCTIRNGNDDVITTVNNFYGTIGVDSTAENVTFPICVEIPPGTPVGEYYATYEVTSDGDDFDPTNNTRTFRFQISDRYMAKEVDGGPYASIAATNFPNWSWGAGYTLPNGSGYILREVEAGIANAASLTPSALGAQAQFAVQVLKLIDDVDGDGLLETGEYIPVGYGEYAFDNDEVDFTIYTVPIYDANTFEEGLELEDGVTYIVLVEYNEPAGTSGSLCRIMGGGEFDYRANNFIYRPTTAGGLGAVACGTHYGDVVSLGNTGSYETDGTSWGPVARMILESVSTKNPVVSNYNVKFLPNPVKDQLRAEVDFGTEVSQSMIRIVDMKGRIHMEEVFRSQQNVVYQKNVEHLSAGSYFLTIMTDAGVRTEPFTIQR